LRVLRDPKDPEYAEMKTWVGRGFDPEKLELDKVNKKLAAIARRGRRKR
jgi:hypothetical protein